MVFRLHAVKVVESGTDNTGESLCAVFGVK